MVRVYKNVVPCLAGAYSSSPGLLFGIFDQNGSAFFFWFYVILFEIERPSFLIV